VRHDLETQDAPYDRDKAILYRMVMENHLCPYGLKSKWMLERAGYEVEDHQLTSRKEIDAFKAKHGVATTPQTFIGGERIGGYDALRERFTSYDPGSDRKTYTPVLMIFALKDIESFSTMFLNYDLLAQRSVGYSYVYPFAEVAAGLLMVAGGSAAIVGSPIALFIGQMRVRWR